MIDIDQNAPLSAFFEVDRLRVIGNRCKVVEGLTLEDTLLCAHLLKQLRKAGKPELFFRVVYITGIVFISSFIRNSSICSVFYIVHFQLFYFL